MGQSAVGRSMGKNTVLCCLLLWGAASGQLEEGTGDGPDGDVEAATEMLAEVPEEMLAEVPDEEVDLVTVRTFLGIVKGKKSETDQGRTYYKFLGIPYAQPPVDELRFLPPKPVNAWGKLVATEDGPVCPQVNFLAGGGFIGDEDCLHLNIYTPSLVSASNPFALKPVMLWIHGGGFTIGSGTENEYDPVLLLDKDVVVVSINYRLGPLGFMTFGNNKVVGNMGLKDQNMAIKWIKNYIRYFGGDPKKITIFGESAGGMSVHAQVLSPFNHGLLAGAIAQSGTLLYKHLHTMRPGDERFAIKAAVAFNCTGMGLDDEMLRCLQDVPVKDLIETTQQPLGLPDSSDNIYSWTPIVDYFSYEPFLPIQPLEALKKGIYNHVPFMSGTTKDEGSLFAILFYDKLAEISENWGTFFPSMIGFDKKHSMEANIIKKYYTGDDFSKENMQSIINLFTDATFLSPDQKTVSLMSEGRSPVFNYQLTYKGTNTAADLFGPAAAEQDFGVFHGDDLQYLFKSNQFVNLVEEPTEEDQKMTELMVTYWTNFAKYGNPTPFKIVDASNWTPVQPGKKNYLDLQPEPVMKQNLEPERMLFWDRMLWSPLEDGIDRRIILDKVSKFLKNYRKQNLSY